MLLGTLLALAIGAAQEETSVFRSETTLVEFTMIALDGKGNPVSDLKPEEITIREKGHERKLAFLRYEGGEQEETTQQLPAGAFSNRPAIAPGPPRNVTAFLLDSLNTASRDQIFARRPMSAVPAGPWHPLRLSDAIWRGSPAGRVSCGLPAASRFFP